MKRLIAICSTLLLTLAISAQNYKQDENSNSTTSGTGDMPSNPYYGNYNNYDNGFSSDDDDEKEKGFVAPKDGSFTMAYDREIYRMRDRDYSDLYRLNGVKIGGTIHARIKGPVGFEIPIFYRFGYMKDTDFSYATTQKSLKKFDWGIQTGLLLCTSYRFNRRFYITLACGPKFDFTVFDFEFMKYTDDSKRTIDYVWGSYTIENSYGKVTQNGTDSDYKQTSLIDIPISLGITLRYKAIGVSFHYDWGMLDRQTNKYYRMTGANKKKDKLNSDYFTVGLQFYPGKGMNK